jgi:glyoxylate/hydroxypyruvate reductase A
MALLIDVGVADWMTNAEIAAEVVAHAPGADVRTREAPGDLAEITMLAVSTLDPDLPAALPRLQLVQKLGAGVETIVAHPALRPDVRVARLKPDEPAREIAEWFLSYILAHQRQHRHYAAEQTARRWSPVAPLEAPRTRVAVLGLGHIGARTARMLAAVGFSVEGWSRSPKVLDAIPCHTGDAALGALLARADHVCAILPSTALTRGFFDAGRLAAMKPGATLLNAGRGDLIDEAALLAALDRGTPGAAVLDVTQTEPLPPDSPLWTHPQVTITPHVSGWHLGDAMADVAANLLRLQAGDALLHEVDRTRGY